MKTTQRTLFNILATVSNALKYRNCYTIRIPVIQGGFTIKVLLKCFPLLRPASSVHHKRGIMPRVLKQETIVLLQP